MNLYLPKEYTRKRENDRLGSISSLCIYGYTQDRAAGVAIPLNIWESGMGRPFIPIPRLGAVIWVHENAIARLEPILGMMHMCRTARLWVWNAKITGARKAHEYNDGMQALKETLVDAIGELLMED